MLWLNALGRPFPTFSLSSLLVGQRKHAPGYEISGFFFSSSVKGCWAGWRHVVRHKQTLYLIPLTSLFSPFDLWIKLQTQDIPEPNASSLSTMQLMYELPPSQLSARYFWGCPAVVGE